MKKLTVSFEGGGPNVDWGGDGSNIAVMRHTVTEQITRIVVDHPTSSEDYPDQTTILLHSVRWYRIREVRDAKG